MGLEKIRHAVLSEAKAEAHAYHRQCKKEEWRFPEVTERGGGTGVRTALEIQNTGHRR